MCVFCLNIERDTKLVAISFLSTYQSDDVRIKFHVLNYILQFNDERTFCSHCSLFSIQFEVLELLQPIYSFGIQLLRTWTVSESIVTNSHLLGEQSEEKCRTIKINDSIIFHRLDKMIFGFLFRFWAHWNCNVLFSSTRKLLLLVFFRFFISLSMLWV